MTSAQTGVRVHVGAGERAVAEAKELRDRAREQRELVTAAEKALATREQGLQRWVADCQSAREMVRSYHGDAGLFEVDADMTPQGFTVP